MALTAFYIAISVTGLVVAVASGIQQCDELQNNKTNSTDLLSERNRTGVCILTDYAQRLGLVHNSCTKYTENRCHLYRTNETHSDESHSVVESIVRTVNSLTSGGTDRDQAMSCGDVLLGIICNSMYLGCDPTTDMPIGLCTSVCLEYSTSEMCLPIFAEVAEGLNEHEKAIDLNGYINCTAHSSSVGANSSMSSLDQRCYQALTGVEKLPHGTTEVVTTTPAVSAREDDERGTGQTKKIALAYVLPSIIVVLGTAIVIVLTLSRCYLRRLKKSSRCVGVALDSYSDRNAFPQLLGVKELYSNRYTLTHIINEDVNHDVERSVLPVTNSTTTTSSGASNATENSAVFQLDLADWATVGEGVLIPFDRVTIIGHLGEGAFGNVVKGLLKDVHVSGREYHMPVAMKTLKNCASYAEMRGLLVESSLMHSFSHPHILSLRGLCLNPKSGAPYLVMPFMENGDLRKFLRRKADMTDGSASVTTYPQGLTHNLLARMCCDVAKGMEYLAEKRLVHRDLAARNCMVDRSLRVKVADFGLTREIYEQDCYRQSSHGQLPIKWMSPESLAYRISNEKTDVWSFGVTCWEVFSLGKVPYPTIDNRDLLDYLEYGRRLSKPRLCNQHVCDIMQLCWKMLPDERPTFSEIVTLLETTPTEDTAHTTRPTHTSCTTDSTTTQQSDQHSTMKRSVTVPITRAEIHTQSATGAIADEEYVEMACKGKDGHEEVLIVPNCSTATNDTDKPTKEVHKYDNVTILSGGRRTMISLPVEQTPHHVVGSPDKEVFILSNDRAKIVTPSPDDPRNSETQEDGSSTTHKRSSSLSPGQASREDEQETGNGESENGLLDSIIHYLQEKTTEGEETETDSDFLAVQMRELETTYKSGSQSATSSLHHNHTHSSRRRSTTDRGSKFTPSVESVAEVPTSPYQHITIYDECPTTPNVTVSFSTGERVTPAETVFSFSRKRSQTDRGSGRGGMQSGWSHREGVHVGICERGREGTSRGSVVSMPGGMRESGGGWRERVRVRERFFSYSAGDYVKMHPAPQQH